MRSASLFGTGSALEEQSFIGQNHSAAILTRRQLLSPLAQARCHLQSAAHEFRHVGRQRDPVLTFDASNDLPLNRLS